MRAKLARPVEILMRKRAKLAGKDIVIAGHAYPTTALGHRYQLSDVHLPLWNAYAFPFRKALAGTVPRRYWDNYVERVRAVSGCRTAHIFPVQIVK